MKKFTIKNFLFLMGLMLITSAVSAQSTIYVKGDVTGGDGSTWAMAFQYLDDAVAAAQSGDQIWVAAGTYIPGGAAPVRDTFFTMKNGVDIYGGFAGNETMLSERNFTTNVTTLSGDIGGDDGVDDYFSTARFANTKNVFVVDTSVNSAILDGFTISHGHTDTAATSTDLRGGGMYILGSPTVRNVIFESNYANFGGGAYPRGLEASGTTFENCVFRNNRGNSGGGLFTAAAEDVMVLNCDFLNNQASAGGGAFPNGNLDLTFDGCVFRGNSANGSEGGAMLVVSVLGLTMDNCVFSSNTTTNRGGAFYLQNSDFTMDQCVVDSNDAGTFGGGFTALTCNFAVTNSSFTGNITGTGFEAGGAIAAASFTGTTSDVILANTSFSQNSGPFGGALSLQGEGTTTVIDDCSFTANTNNFSGGAIACAFGSETIVLNSEFTSNVATELGGGIYIASEGSNLAVENTVFTGNIATNFGGGAIGFTDDGFHVLDSCTFVNNNSVNSFGGAITYQPDSFDFNLILIDQCHFFNNSASDQGGALNIGDGDVQIANSLFNFNKAIPDPMAGNIAGRGGFLANNCGIADTSRVTLIHNTIANNTGDFAGGMSQWEDTSGGNTIANAEIILLNNVFVLPEIGLGINYAIEAGTPEVISWGGNVAEGTSLAPYLTNTNDQAGFDRNLFGFADSYLEDDFSLLETSPLKDKGVIVADYEVEVDHRGVVRSSLPDIGAFEFDTTTVSTRPEIGDANSLQLSPNPAIDYTLVSLTNDYTGEVMVRVSNVLGQTISVAQHDKNTNEYQFELNTAQLTPGLYEVSLEFNNQVVTKKLMKRR